jgi:hypothetical protein
MFSSFNVSDLYLSYLIINSNLVESVGEKLLALCAWNLKLKCVHKPLQFDGDEVITK